MRILIDGHNALHALRVEGATHAAQRAALLRFVAERTPRATVYFDARDAPPHAIDTAREHGVDVVYCRHREADAAILDEVRDSDQSGALIVVSNDREVCGRARQLGARVASVHEFFGPGRSRDTGAAEESPGALQVLRGRWRFKPSDFGLPDEVDLEDPDID